MADADALAQRLGIVARGSIGLRNDGGDASASVKAPDWFGAGVQPAAALAGCAAVAETATLVGFLAADDCDRADRRAPGAAALRGAAGAGSARPARPPTRT